MVTSVTVACDESGNVFQLRRQLIQLVPGEGPRFLVLTPEGKIHVLTSEHGQTVYQLPHGVWKAVPFEKLYVMAFSTTGTLSVRPECHLFGEVPYVHGLVRDAEHKCLVLLSPEVAVVDNMDILRDALAAKFVLMCGAPLPRIQKLFLWLHPGRPAQMLALLADTQIVWAALGHHGDKETIASVSPANGSHVWSSARDEVRLTFHVKGGEASASDMAFSMWRPRLWNAPKWQVAMVELL